MDGWKGKGGGKFDGGKGKGKGKGGKGFKGGKDQPMVVPQQVFNPLGHQDQFKGGKGKGKGHSHHHHHHHHHQMTHHHHHHHHQHQHHHHHHHHQHQHQHHHHQHQHQHSHHHQHHQHQQQRHQKQQRPAAVPPPPPPAAVTVTDEMLVLPPLAHTVAAPVTLSYKRVQRLLLDIVQSHRHRLHLPHSLLSLVCHYAASSESSLPFALPSSAPVTIGEGAMPFPNSGREGTNVSVVLFASPDKESSSAAHSLTLVVKKSEKDGVHLLMGGSANEGEEHVAAAKRHVLEQSGIDLSDLPKERFVPFVDFTYRHDGKDLSSHVFLVNTWDEPSTLEATGVVKATLATLLSGPEGKSMSSFELLATSDMLLEVLERTLGARLLDTLAARKASEPTAPLTLLELSILDINALGPIDSLTGLIDRARLENVAGALERDLSVGELNSLLEPIMNGDKKPEYALLDKPSVTAPPTSA